MKLFRREDRILQPLKNELEKKASAMKTITAKLSFFFPFI